MRRGGVATRRAATAACACVLIGALAACRALLGIDDPTIVGADAAADGPADGAADGPVIVSDAADASPPPKCAHGAPFTTGSRVWHGAQRVYSARFTPDESVAYFSTYDPTVDGGFEIVATGRAPDGGLANALSPQGAVNTVGDEYWPTLTPDGQRMFYEGPEGPGLATSRIWIAERDPASATFKNPQVHSYFLGIPNTVTIGAPYLSKTGQMVFSSTRRDADAGVLPDGGIDTFDLWLATVGSAFLVTGERRLDELTTNDTETFPVLSSDGEELFFSRTALTAVANDEARIYVASRPDGGDQFGPAQRVALPWDGDDAGGAGLATGDWSSWLSEDNCRLYVIRFSLPGGELRGDLWMAQRSLN